MGRDHWALLFGLCLRFSNEHARNEHECSAKSHLQSCGERWRIHVPVPHEDLEGIVAGQYNPQRQSSWIKIKNPSVHVGRGQRKTGRKKESRWQP
jgi:hypothetical protein